MKLNQMLGIGALSLALAGCDPPAVHEYRQQAETAPGTLEDTVRSLSGTIVKVQPSSVSYQVRNGSGSHEFEYVMVEDDHGQLHTLVYPCSKAIVERPATIQYRRLSSGSMDAANFVQNYVNACRVTDDNILIEAEGIITGDGIKYE